VTAAHVPALRVRAGVRLGHYPVVVEYAGRIADAFAERIREQEEHALSPHAVRSYEHGGRLADEEPCSLRTPFQRDRDRIVHSKSFRRLKGKTQVFIDPEGDHYRTRMTHTLETTAISRVVARALRLNEDLTEAIGLGHDVGHPPFGHAGEAALDRLLSERYGRRFHHNRQSLRVVDAVERDGRGLNLTWEVRDGILTHTGPDEPETLEGRIVRIVDRVAYINHDIDDALRAGVLRPGDLPADEIALLGETGSRRIDRLVHDLVEASAGAGDIVQSPEVGSAMLSLRAFMFERVYLGPAAEAEHRRAAAALERIFDYLVAHPDEAPPGGGGDEVERVTDYIAGMTDRFALAYAGRL
jgi:dGTPase